MDLDIADRRALVGSTLGIGFATAKLLAAEGWGRIVFVSSESGVQVPAENFAVQLSFDRSGGPSGRPLRTDEGE